MLEKEKVQEVQSLMDKLESLPKNALAYVDGYVKGLSDATRKEETDE